MTPISASIETAFQPLATIGQAHFEGDEHIYSGLTTGLNRNSSSEFSEANYGDMIDPFPNPVSGLQPSGHFIHPLDIADEEDQSKLS